MAIGSHRLEYEVVQGWERLPEGWAFTEVVGVGVDSRERVFVFCRGPHPLIVFDKEGRFADAWGAVPERRGLDASGILQAAVDGQLHGLVLLDADPIADFPDRRLARDAIANVDFVIACDAFLTESTRAANVFLPVTVWAEKPAT